MKWKDYLIIIKHSGLSVLAHFLPFGLIVAFTQQFMSSSTFNNKPCSYARFGNSGLFLVFSESTQKALEESRRESREWAEQERQEQKEKQYLKLKEEFND